MTISKNTGSKELLKFSFPVTIAYVSTTSEMALICWFLTRMVEPGHNIAVFSLAYSLNILTYAHNLPFSNTGAVFVRDWRSFKKILCVVVFGLSISYSLLLLMFYPQIYNFVTNDILDLPVAVVSDLHNTLIFCLPWPICIVIRKLFHGIAVYLNKPSIVALGGITRVLSVALIMAVLANYDLLDFKPSIKAAIALSSALLLETSLVMLLTLHRMKKRFQPLSSPPYEVRASNVILFMLPLVLYTITLRLEKPVTTFLLTLSKEPVRSIAVFSITMSIITILFKLVQSVEDVFMVKIADPSSNTSKVSLIRFLISVSLIALSFTIIALLPPTQDILFTSIFPVPEGNISIVKGCLTLLAPLGIIAVGIFALQGYFSAVKSTTPIAISKALYIASTTAIYLILIKVVDMPESLLLSLAVLVSSPIQLAFLAICAVIHHKRRIANLGNNP